MGLGDNEIPIVSSKLIVTTFLSKIIGRYLKREFNYSEFIYCLVYYLCKKIKFFKRDPDKRPSILKMYFLLFLFFSNVICGGYYLFQDYKEILSKNNDPYLFFIGFLILIFNKDNLPHIIFHITEIKSNITKFNEIIKKINKENETNKKAEMHKELEIKPLKKHLDGAGGDDSDDDYFEEIINKIRLWIN
ncbi:hypothetical protein ACTFIY_002026 [Dictyostelium cf. discoideum]